MKNLSSLVAMIISEILIIIAFLLILSKQKNKTQLKNAMLILLTCMFVWTLGSVLQICYQNTSIPPVFWEKIAGVGVFFSPVAFLALAVIFARKKIDFKWYHSLFLVIPIISTIILLTNESHHLFFEHYSYDMSQIVYGDYFPIHSTYTYALFGIGLLLFIGYSIKNSGFFSKQSILIILGVCVPLVLNLLGTANIIPITTYITPISFSFMIIIYTFAIFKFNFGKIAPIPLQRILDRISDGYIVIDENNFVTDFNVTFEVMFHSTAEQLRNANIFDWIESHNDFPIDGTLLKDCMEKTHNSDITLHFEKKLKHQDKYFNVEINSIRNKKNFLGTLILFKDTTQHMLDMQTIRNNENMLMERERLASLGQLIGGIAHNLKTPIMSIAGASVGLTDLVKEYEASVGDPEVTTEDHHAIAKDMKDWIEKIKSYTEYMSDVITAVKGQAVTLSEEQAVSFTLDELVKRVDILMRHELKNALINLNIAMQTDEHTVLKGNINSLVQVINNMISNAIQAYNGEPNKEIKLILADTGKNITISVQDFANGLPEEVQKKLFKEMITTKGKNGTGLGLFMSYSTIRAHFNGTITYETAKGKGTIFNIVLPK